MESVILTNMCMIEDKENGKVLVQNRIKGGWTGIAFPGGHVELFEPIVDSVIREVKEETGLAVHHLKLCGIKDWCQEDKRYMVFLFKTSSYTGDLIERTEEGDVFWVETKNIHTLQLASGFEKMLEVFLNDELNENFITLDKEMDKWTHLIK